MSTRPRRPLPCIPILTAALLMTAGCGSQAASPAPPSPTVAVQAPLPQIEVASSEAVVGKNRFTFGLIKNNHPIQNISRVKTIFYLLHGSSGRVEAVTTASFNYFARDFKHTAENSAATEIGGVFVTYPRFGSTGTWAVQVQLPPKVGGALQPARFSVVSHGFAPAVGTRAIPSHNPTVAQLPLTKLDSARPVYDPEMHRLSIAQALAQHKPLVVLFSTPAFCESRMCGPLTQIVHGVALHYGSRTNFVHIEVYKNAVFSQGYAPTFLQWHLRTEPWIFVIDRRGIIRSEFEGPTSSSEIETALNTVLARG